MYLADLLTSLASAATVGVLIVALVQIAMERRRRHQAEEKEVVERHFAQARLISAVLGSEEPREHLTEGGRRSTW